MTLQPIGNGTRVGGRYEILGQLESGTRADIRTARDLVLGRVVSVKLSRVQEAPFTAGFYADGDRSVEAALQVYPFLYQPCEVPFRLRRRQYAASTGDLLTDVARILESLAETLTA